MSAPTHLSRLRAPEGDDRDIRPQALEASCKAALEPYVPIEVSSSAAPNDSGIVVVVRVPDIWPKPVFVSDRGILVRRGPSNGPATVSEIGRWWSQSEPTRAAMSAEVWQAVGTLQGVARPL